MTTDKAIEYILAKRREMGYNADLDFESVAEIYNMIKAMDTTKENLDKFVEYMF